MSKDLATIILLLERLNENVELLLSDQKQIFTVPEAARFLGVTVSCIHAYTHKGKIPFFKPKGGKYIYFKKADLEAFATSTKPNRASSDPDIEKAAQEYIDKHTLNL